MASAMAPPGGLGSSGAGPAAPAGPAEQRQQEESAAYFSELLSYSLERLRKEPELLRADQEQLRRQAQDTAVGHYRSFIDTTRCLADLRQQLQAATGHLDDLERGLPKLQAACDRFRQDAAAIAAKRADNRQLYSACLAGSCCWQGMALRASCPLIPLCVLCWPPSLPTRPPTCPPSRPPPAGTHPTVLEVLEVPQLIDTCCRSGNFDEALDLRACVNTAGAGVLLLVLGGIRMLLQRSSPRPCSARHRMPPATARLALCQTQCCFPPPLLSAPSSTGGCDAW